MKKIISITALLAILISSGCSITFDDKKESNTEQKTLEEIKKEQQAKESDEDDDFENYYNDGYDEGYEEGYRRAQEEEAYRNKKYGNPDDYYPDQEYEHYPEVDNSFLFPSDRYYITEADLRGLSKKTVALMRNEIYARHGYIFSNYEYHKYFSQKAWYYPDQEFTEDRFNDIERANKSFIVNYEKKMGWR